MMKLVQVASDSSATLNVSPAEPIAWALSSITNSLCLSAIFLMAAMSAHWPYRWTGMIAFVFGVMAASIFAGSMQPVFGSESTNTAVAPAIQIASAVAKNVFGW